jgi:hypothetical protein
LLAVNVPKAIRAAGNTPPAGAGGPLAQPAHLVP